ncbi:MAG: hypothetical protein IT460_14110 [Planctomycetes bacterium]|nr:hypothetical protein [Planctomycetota bacterium]
MDEPPTSPTPMDAPRPGSLSRAGREAYEVARRAGKPLLAVLAPVGPRARRERAGVLGALLRRRESLPVLALVEVACVPAADASALGVPAGLDAMPFAVLVETDGREPRGVALSLPLSLRRAVRDGLLDDPERFDDASDDRGHPSRAPLAAPSKRADRHVVVARARARAAFARLASALEAAVVGTQLPRRVAASVAVVSPARAEGFSAAVRRGIGLAPEVADEAAAVIRAAGDAAPDRRAFADRLLAAAAGRRLLEQPPPGARWGGEPEPFGDGSWCGTPFADEPPVAPRLHILPPVP